MINPESRLAISKFDVKTKSSYDTELLDRLVEPTEDTALIHNLVNPRFIFGRVFKGDFRNKDDWAAFNAEFERRAANNPGIRDPYVRLDDDWTPIPYHQDPDIQVLLQRFRVTLPEAAYYAEKNARNERDVANAQYLYSMAKLLPDGEWDRAFVELLKLDEPPVQWAALPIESYPDPRKEKRFFQSWNTWTNEDLTDKAQLALEKYRETGARLYGRPPFPAKVLASWVRTFAGLLGEKGSSPSGFNVPNDQRVAEVAGANLVQMFIGRIIENNRDNLSPSLEAVTGRTSKFWDIFNFTVGHEGNHGYRYEGEDVRWGSYRSVGRELWANDRTVIEAAEGDFSRKFFFSAVRGRLAFDCNDIKDSSRRLWVSLYEPTGENQPTLDDLVKLVGDYGVGAYIALRHLKNAGGLRRGYFDVDKLVYQAMERDKILDRLALQGNPEEARKFFENAVDEQKIFPVDYESKTKDDTAVTAA